MTHQAADFPLCRSPNNLMSQTARFKCTKFHSAPNHDNVKLVIRKFETSTWRDDLEPSFGSHELLQRFDKLTVSSQRRFAKPTPKASRQTNAACGHSYGTTSHTVVVAFDQLSGQDKDLLLQERTTAEPRWLSSQYLRRA